MAEQNRNIPQEGIALAMAKEETDSKEYQPAMRKCLRCGKMFKSTWVGNRICSNCN